MNFKDKCDSVRILATVSVGALAMATVPAMAQDATAAPQQPAASQTKYDGDAIVVTGITKQDANIQDTPIAITAFSGETLTEQGIGKVDEIATFTPGFNIRGAGNNPTALTLAMRGQIQNDNIATLEPSVGTYLDEMYIARAYGLNTELVDVESVQVLKGPQGTLFGRNTSAGAVLIQTANPRYGEISGKLSATYGRFDERTGQAVLNLGLSDSLAVRGALWYQKRDGYKTDVNTGAKYEGRETINGRVKLGWKPTETLEILLSGEWYDTDIDGPIRQNLFFNAPAAFGPAKPIVDGIAAAERDAFGGNPNLAAYTSPSAVVGADPRGPFNKTKTQTYMAKFILDTSFGQVRWINGYRGVQSENIIDLDGSSVVGHFTEGKQDLKQYSTELQLTGTAFEDRLNFATGLTYFRETGFDQSRSNLFGGKFAAGPTVPPEYVGRTSWSNFSGTLDNDSFGMYGQLNYELTDALSITGGLRYSIDDKRVITQSGDVVDNSDEFVRCTPSTVAIPCLRERHKTFTNLSYTAGIDYDLTDNILIYAKYSKGYRSGAMQLRTVTLADSTPSDPEIVHEQEIGIKTTFLGGRGRFNVAGYHNKVSDAQRSPVLAPNGVSQTVIENADTETWGVEADASIEVVDGFTIFASGALTDPKYTRYEGKALDGVPPNQAIVTVDKSDYLLVGLVKKQYSVGANYSRDFGGVGLDANIVYAWQGRMPQIDIPASMFTSTAPGGLGLTQAQADQLAAVAQSGSLGILNARVALSFGPERNFELALWGKNLTNDQEQQYTLLLSNIYVGTSYNEPRSYGVTASFKF
ncbi:TonB-dependent receptor [Sphingopyxis panaciterrulae]|uniref:Iron complex outermembrane receptor protein n=1 Tax=Sphingopyxis panaciterrulae TaxID=462372 RepID=A0A7W9B5R1_9SPHN|nr:TonB-dependent receptor [Sphingopyxis panaciterrulae]MBB5706742.1 iron complex outermembrane receptor protein [Sphingopyxis panaciterrulae]